MLKLINYFGTDKKGIFITYFGTEGSIYFGVHIIFTKNNDDKATYGRMTLQNHR
jgi:hypothetical protein